MPDAPVCRGTIPCRWCGNPLPVAFQRALKCSCGRHTWTRFRWRVIYARVGNNGDVTYVGRTTTTLGRRREAYRKREEAGSEAASWAAGHALVPLLVLGSEDDGLEVERKFIQGFAIVARFRGHIFYNKRDFLGKAEGRSWWNAAEDPAFFWTAGFVLSEVEGPLRALWGDVEFERVKATVASHSGPLPEPQMRRAEVWPSWEHKPSPEPEPPKPESKYDPAYG